MHGRAFARKKAHVVLQVRGPLRVVRISRSVLAALENFYANKTRDARVKESMDSHFSRILNELSDGWFSLHPIPPWSWKNVLFFETRRLTRGTRWGAERDESANDHQPRTQSLTRSLQRCEFARRPIAHLRSHLEKEVPFASDACCAHTMSGGSVHARAFARARAHAQ